MPTNPNEPFALGLVKGLAKSFLPERQRLMLELRVTAPPFRPPTEVAQPNVRAESRTDLKALSHGYLSGDVWVLSPRAKDRAQKVLRSLVQEREYQTQFPMSLLHGCTASRSNMHNRPDRIAQDSMAEMGSRVDDLRDLGDRIGIEAIEACLNWDELRLHDGIELLTDNWHKRFYWCNKGGSHHMAVLCRELQAEGKEWYPPVTVREQLLDLEALRGLGDSMSMYMVMKTPNEIGLGHVFGSLDYRQGNTTLRERLGVSAPQVDVISGVIGAYQLVIVDHGRPYASIARSKLDQAVRDGRAMPLRQFLESTIDPKKRLHNQAGLPLADEEWPFTPDTIERFDSTVMPGSQQRIYHGVAHPKPRMRPGEQTMGPRGVEMAQLQTKASPNFTQVGEKLAQKASDVESARRPCKPQK